MMLHFDRALVERLLNHSKQSPDWRKPFGGNASTKAPGLWLVGDDGVYLMSNGLPGLYVDETKEKNIVAYAREVDPTRLDFETWWRNKRASFGGDDDSQYLPERHLTKALASYADAEPFVLNVTPSGIGILNGRKKLTQKTK